MKRGGGGGFIQAHAHSHVDEPKLTDRDRYDHFDQSEQPDVKDLAGHELPELTTQTPPTMPGLECPPSASCGIGTNPRRN